MDYNNLSEKLKALVKWPTDSKGKPLERVVYETLHPRTTMYELNEDNERSPADTHPGIVIPNLDTIWDEGKGQYVQIAYFKTVNQPAPGTQGSPLPALLTIEFKPDNMGFLYVPRKEQVLFQFLELTNSNKDSVNPDAAKPDMGYLLMRVKPEEIAGSGIDFEAEVHRITGLIFGMSEEEMRALAPKLEIPSNQEPKALQMALLKVAKVKPSLVNNLLDGEQTKVEADVRKAQLKKVIEFSRDTQGFVWYESRETVALIPPGVPDKTAALVQFLTSGADGARVRDAIRDALVKARNKKEQASLPDENEGFDDDNDDDEADEELPVSKPQRSTSVKKIGNKSGSKKAGPIRKAAPAVPAATPAEADY